VIYIGTIIVVSPVAYLPKPLSTPFSLQAKQTVSIVFFPIFSQVEKKTFFRRNRKISDRSVGEDARSFLCTLSDSFSPKFYFLCSRPATTTTRHSKIVSFLWKLMRKRPIYHDLFLLDHTAFEVGYVFVERSSSVECTYHPPPKKKRCVKALTQQIDSL
jgi:hypothetical protein